MVPRLGHQARTVCRDSNALAEFAENFEMFSVAPVFSVSKCFQPRWFSVRSKPAAAAWADHAGPAAPTPLKCLAVLSGV
jgi:hypothetical protein